MKLEIKKDRIEINKIIENCLPLMKMNKLMTQECADAIVGYFIEKENKMNSPESTNDERRVTSSAEDVSTTTVVDNIDSGSKSESQDANT